MLTSCRITYYTGPNATGQCQVIVVPIGEANGRVEQLKSQGFSVYTNVY